MYSTVPRSLNGFSVLCSNAEVNFSCLCFQKSAPIKKLQHAIEDQIYRILRKSRIITNIRYASAQQRRDVFPEVSQKDRTWGYGNFS